MKNDKSNSKEEEYRSEGAVGERVDSIEDHLTKIEEMLEELFRNDQKSRKSQQISSETYAGAGVLITFGIFVLSFALALFMQTYFLLPLLPLLLLYASGVLIIFSGLQSIIGTQYSLKKGILIESPGFWEGLSYSFFKKVYQYDKIFFSGIILMIIAAILMFLAVLFFFMCLQPFM